MSTLLATQGYAMFGYPTRNDPRYQYDTGEDQEYDTGEDQDNLLESFIGGPAYQPDRPQNGGVDLQNGGFDPDTHYVPERSWFQGATKVAGNVLFQATWLAAGTALTLARVALGEGAVPRPGMRFGNQPTLSADGDDWVDLGTDLKPSGTLEPKKVSASSSSSSSEPTQDLNLVAGIPEEVAEEKLPRDPILDIPEVTAADLGYEETKLAPHYGVLLPDPVAGIIAYYRDINSANQKLDPRVTELSTIYVERKKAIEVLKAIEYHRRKLEIEHARDLEKASKEGSLSQSLLSDVQQIQAHERNDYGEVEGNTRREIADGMKKEKELIATFMEQPITGIAIA